MRLPIARNVIEGSGAAGPEREVLGEMIVVGVRVLMARLGVRRMGPDASLDEMQSRIMRLMVNIDVRGVPVRRHEQSPPLGLEGCRH